MSKFGIGQPVRRVEDQRLITGEGRYTDDINLPGQAHGYVLRSPTAHAAHHPARHQRRQGGPRRAAGADRRPSWTPAIPCLIPITNRDGTERADPRTRSCARTRSTMSATMSPSSSPRRASPGARTRPS